MAVAEGSRNPPQTDALSLRGNRILALDGLRGLAIVAIMGYHFVGQFHRPQQTIDSVFYTVVDAGWIGVELFFVLSGFLVTATLYDRKGSHAFLRSFHGRRALRILPLYYGLLLVLFVALPLATDRVPEKLQSLANHQWWFWLFLSNWFFAKQGGFGSVSGGYLWWLSLDQQFCLVWPLLVYWLNRRGLIAVSLCLLMGSCILRLLLLATGTGPVSVYLITFTHLDGLAFGSLLAAR
jgi:peptidoglycan/LPS O-acetylase OafA/YrhL